MEQAKEMYHKFKEVMLDVSDDRLVVYLGNYFDYQRRGLDKVFFRYSPYMVNEYIESHQDEIDIRRILRVYSKK